MTPDNDANTMLILGEMRGQLREIAHNQNNATMIQQEMVKEVAKLKGIPQRLDKIDERLVALETEKATQAGVSRGLEALRRWSPTLVACVAALVFLIKSGAITL